MIVHDRPLLDDTPISTDGPGERPSMAILQAAMAIRQEGRDWLGDRLGLERERQPEQQPDREHEVQRLEKALQGRESAIAAISEQAAAAARLNSQLSRQISTLWDEREQLIQSLNEASKEREQLAGMLGEVRSATDMAARTIDDLIRERDALTTELARVHGNGSAGQDTPAADLTTDLAELGCAIELIGEALGDVRRLALETCANNHAAAPIVADDAANQTGAQTTLPALEAEVGRLGERIDTLVAGLAELLDGRRTTWRRSSARHPAGALIHSTPGATDDEHRVLVFPPAHQDSRPRPLLTLQAVERALARALPSVGLPRGVVAPLISAWLAGAMPILSGREALTALRVCGRVLAADQLVIVPADADHTYPEQLFMQHGADGSHLTTEGSELLNLLLEAQSDAGSERLSLVVFEGLNRSSVERVLLPILQLASRRDDATVGHTLDDVLPEGLAEDGPYGALLGQPWPSNVLVAATIADSDAEAIRPLPSALWARAAYVCLDHLPTAPEGVRASDTDPASQLALQQRVSFVPSELWDGWTAETRDEAEMTACVSGDVEILDSRRDVVATWRMIEAALAVIGRCHPAERTASVLLHHAVVPWAVSAGLDREAAQLVQSQSPGLPAEQTPQPCCACLERAIRGRPAR